MRERREREKRERQREREGKSDQGSTICHGPENTCMLLSGKSSKCQKTLVSCGRVQTWLIVSIPTHQLLFDSITIQRKI